MLPSAHKCRTVTAASGVGQGVDLIAGGRSKKTHRTAPKSDNVYLKLLVKVGPAFVVVHTSNNVSCSTAAGS
eukprot:scaffold121462_cov18-Tisochrysis_lutea.AAC.5